MQDRSFGVTALAFSSVMIGLFCQFGAIALILTASVFSTTGSVEAGMAMVIGALFLGLTFASYFLAYGFWTRKHWSWAGGVALFVSLVVGNVALSVISGNYISSVLPLVASIAGVWSLLRPGIKAELLGTQGAAKTSAAAPGAFKAAEPAR